MRSRKGTVDPFAPQASQLLQIFLPVPGMQVENAFVVESLGWLGQAVVRGEFLATACCCQFFWSARPAESRQISFCQHQLKLRRG